MKRVGPTFCHYCQFENSLTLQILGPATGFEFAIPLGGVNRYGSEFAKEWLPFRGGSHSPFARGIVRVIVRELGTRQSKTGRNPFALFSDFGLSAAVVPCSARNPPTNQKVGSSSPPLRANISETGLVLLINEQKGEKEEIRDDREFSWCCSFPWGFGCRGTERRLASWRAAAECVR